MAQLGRKILVVRFYQQLIATFAVSLVALVVASGGCGNSNDGRNGFSGSDPNANSSSGSASDDSGTPPGIFTQSNDADAPFSSFDGSAMAAGPLPTCAAWGSGWKCAVNDTCGTPTTLTGKVYDPAGKNPLYNVVVFIPNDPNMLPPITRGTATCNTCDSPIGDYVVATATDESGTFVLQKVPTGKNVPVVVQVGKWRRTIYVNTKDCATTTAPKGALRLPRTQKEGNMPQMALLTGGLDDLGCFMRRMGIDPAEYSSPLGGGRLDIYQGTNASPFGAGGAGPGLSTGTAGDCTQPTCPLWASKKSLESYDIVLLACEGAEQNNTKPAAGMTAMHDWLNEGGKVFATHFHYTWFKNNPATDFQSVATWLGPSVGSGMGNYAIENAFPKGKSFQIWLNGVQGATGNTIALNGVANSVSNINTATTQRWIYDPMTSGGGEAGPPANNVKYLSFETPIGGLPPPDGGEDRTFCGKAVFSDLHVGSQPMGDVPGSCDTADLSAQEKALEWLFFDLSACVQPDTRIPVTIPPAR